MESPKVFVSHASEDKVRFVLDFASKLREKGIDAWLDKWEIRPGDSLVDKIFEEGIGSAQVMIIVISQFSVNKAWVREELNAGIIKRIQKKAKIIPVLIDDVEVPESLKNTVRVSIRNLDSYDSELNRIVLAIFDAQDKPELGAPPAYVSQATVSIPGLTRADSLIVKLLGEMVQEKQSTFGLVTDDILAKAKELDIPEEEGLETLEILLKRGYLKAIDRGAGRGYPLNVSVTQFGFEQYAKAYLPGYASIVTDVMSRIAIYGDKDSAAIMTATGQPEVVVRHVMDTFKSRGLIKTIQTMGRGIPLRIIEVSAELKRMLRSA